MTKVKWNYFLVRDDEPPEQSVQSKKKCTNSNVSDNCSKTMFGSYVKEVSDGKRTLLFFF